MPLRRRSRIDMVHNHYSATHTTQRAARATHPASRFLAPVLLLAALLFLAYGAITVVTRDILWLRSPPNSRPVHIVIHHDRGQTDLWPGHPHFDPLASAIQNCLAQRVQQPSGIQFSQASISAAKSRMVTIEAFFSKPVRLRTWFDDNGSTHMLFPITARHADLPFVIFAQNDRYLSSPALLNTVEPLHQALQSLGYYCRHDASQPAGSQDTNP